MNHFALFHYLFLKSLVCSRLQMPPFLFLTSMLFSALAVSSTVCYVTVLFLQGVDCFIICLLHHCSVLGFSLLFFCILRHYTVSSRQGRRPSGGLGDGPPKKFEVGGRPMHPPPQYLEK